MLLTTHLISANARKGGKTSRIQQKLDRLGVSCVIGQYSDYDWATRNLTIVKECHVVVAPDCPLAAGEQIEIPLLIAVLESKPIIIDDVNTLLKLTPIVREILMARLSKIYMYDIETLDDEDLLTLMRNVASEKVNYSLNKAQVILLKASLRAHFRRLLPKKGLITTSQV
jgi:hypothetical protein